MNITNAVVIFGNTKMKKGVANMKLSSHFTSEEFVCSCCGRSHAMSKLLIDRLENMFTIMDAKAIYVNSGYRCENNPWGSKTDAHRRGIAVDIRVQKKDGSWYTSWDIAEVAERLGFGGIGLMLPDSCHVDTRDTEPYLNNHWFGNEYAYGNTPKNDWIKTFQRGTVFAGEKNNSASNNDTLEIKLQKILNNKGYNLDVDGIIGNITLTDLRDYTIEPNDSGELTKWTQELLKVRGYDVDVNGTADEKTMNAIHKFQKDNNLGEGILSGGDWGVLLQKGQV